MIKSNSKRHNNFYIFVLPSNSESWQILMAINKNYMLYFISHYHKKLKKICNHINFL